jgi:hypothetical protein
MYVETFGLCTDEGASRPDGVGVSDLQGSRKVYIRLSGKWNSNSHGAGPVY